MHGLRFWELLFNASKNVQENIRPFFWFCVQLILLKPDLVLTVLWTSMINNQSDQHPFLQLKIISTDLSEAPNTHHQSSPSYQSQFYLSPKSDGIIA